MEETIDVAIVGAGPAGCHVAELLGKTGLNIHVFEEHTAVGEPVDCSGIIGVEAAERLNIDPSIKLGEIESFVLVSPSGLQLKFEPDSPLAFVIDRAGFDRWFARTLHGNGVSLHLGANVASLEVRKGGVELDVLERSGECGRVSVGQSTSRRTRVSASVVVLATGPRYRWQKTLGMGSPSRLVKTAQVEVAVRDLDHVRIFLGSKVAPGSFAWQVPFQRDGQAFARIGVSSQVPARSFLEGILRRLEDQGFLDSWGHIRSWVIPLSAIPRSYSDRVIAVGDAAGQTKPTTGGGLYYGLLCAREAATTILEAFETGDFSARTLRRYESRWRRRIGRELRTGASFRHLGERLTDHELDEIIRLLQTDGALATIRKKASFDWHRDVISFVLRHPQLGRIFLKTLFR